jgi:tetratricopeptide (TPR) repeat protein
LHSAGTPDDPVAQYHLGMAYVQAGDWDKAKGALKRALALKPELLRARPKRLRFLFLNVAGRLVSHARKMVLRLGTAKQRIQEWLQARPLLAAAS